VARLNGETNKVLQDASIVNLLQTQGLVLTGGTPAVFATRVKREYDDWVKVLRESKLKIE
jgi:tripartite-type tricarboxylate transporter receptor subunit TctC